MPHGNPLFGMFGPFAGDQDPLGALHDIKDVDGGLVATFNVCGVNPQTLGVDVEGGVLRLVGGEAGEEFERAFRLSLPTDKEAVTAVVKWGLLTVTLPAPKARKSTVPIVVED
jgi:HSP20 family molecular chaperone IbpA